MKFSRKAAIFLTLAMGALLLTVCSETTISKINADPGRYKNKEVGVVGRVNDSYGIMGTGAYEVDDGTGLLWVATTRGVPLKGHTVGVKGHITQALRLVVAALVQCSKRSGRKAKAGSTGSPCRVVVLDTHRALPAALPLPRR